MERQYWTASQVKAIDRIESLTDSKEKDLLIYLIANICQVGCGEEDGCFYCEQNTQRLKAYNEQP